MLNGTSPVVEYAVKMVQFPQEAQLDRVLARGALENHHIDQLAKKLAAFHSDIRIAGPETTYGLPSHIHELVRSNFDQVFPTLRRKVDVDRLHTLMRQGAISHHRFSHIRTFTNVCLRQKRLLATPRQKKARRVRSCQL